MLELTEQGREVFRKHHPGLLQSDEQIIRQFVVRQPELEILLDLLRGNLDSPSCQHALILGPRGRGKSTLLTRIAAELRTNSEFAPRLLPVWFADGSAEVFDAASFWLDTLFHLARAVEPEIASELRDTRADLMRAWRGEALEERARGAVLDAAAQMDRRLVLMVENLQSLFGNTETDFGWKLRATLQAEPSIILLATATTRFEGLDDAKAPFFELFHPVSLEPLSTEDCRRLWERITGEPVNGRDIRPLEILTGGSPRLLVIVGGFTAHRSARGLLERLATLIDDHSEYFRSQLDALPTLERRVFLAVADLWRPSDAGEIAARAMLDVRAVSVMLGRLRKRGAITVVPEGKKQYYAVAERLVCYYYKLRREQNGAGVIHQFVQFMAHHYSPAERAQRFSDLFSEARTVAAIREGLARAIADQPDLEKAIGAENSPFRQEILTLAESIRSRRENQLMESIASATSYAELAQRLNVAKRSRELLRSESADMRLASTLIRFSVDQYAKGNEEGRVGALRLLASHLSDSMSPHVLRQVGAALIGVASTECSAGQFRQALEICRKTINLFEGYVEWSLQVPVAQAWNLMGDAQRGLGNLVAALEAHEAVVTKFETNDKSALSQEVDRALLYVGLLKETHDDSDSAQVFFERIIAHRKPTDSVLGVVSRGSAFLGKAMSQQSRGLFDPALETIGQAIEYFERKQDASPRIQTLLALSMVQKGRILSGKRDFVAAGATYEEVVTRFGETAVRGSLVQVATALAHLGLSHAERGDIEAAATRWDEVVRRFSATDEPWIQNQVVRALLWKAHGALLSERAPEALVLCDEAESRLAQVSEESQPGLTWSTLCYRVRALVGTGMIHEAVRGFRAVHEAFLSENAWMVRDIQQLVPDLVAAGASAAGLAELLESEKAKADALWPLVVALHRHAGEPVRAPTEVIEVANDIGELMKSGATTAGE